ncbi:MAG: T9SS type A sorting domain-containing protein, partial [Calditrichia bacterium]|nr:T9SS type A sorting domain-containing protein [Calditrichia bacterium]
KSYSINAANTGTMRNTGSPVNITSTVIPVETGWNWIGYFHQEILNINDALATMPASAGDRIKSQTEFAEYISSTGTWEGSLDRMLPGQGYILKSNTGGDLEYPALNKIISQASVLSYMEKPDWAVNAKDYEYSMSFTAVFEFDEQEMRDTSLIISAFVNDTCRGVSKLQYIPELEKYISFLLVYGNNADGDTLSFKIYQPEEDLTRQVEETAIFNSDEINGNLESPFVFTALPIGDELVPYTFYLNQNYPNPFNPETIIEYGLPHDEKVKLIIYNILGQKIKTLVNTNQKAGRYKITFNAAKPTLPNGVYFYYLKAGDYKRTRKMLILK